MNKTTTKKLKVGINGFGRIGRIFTRVCLAYAQENKLGFEIVAINDLLDLEEMAYLLRHDSAHGKLPNDTFPIKTFIDPKTNDKILSIKDHTIHVTQCKNPREIPWDRFGVDIVLESTGLFLTKDTAKAHLEGGRAKYVLLSAPSKEDSITTFVMGVNHEKFNPSTDYILSNASCTTNCLAPLVKIIDEHFGVEEALMSTIHALTASQKIVDGPGGKDFCAGRSAFVNIVPASTGAAKAVGLVLPHLKGKITGTSFRVPVIDGSVVDLTVRVKRPTSLEEITKKIQEEISNVQTKPYMKDVMEILEDPTVSSDIIGNTHSSIFDPKASMQLNPSFFKLVSWYDNEMGYSCRLKDMIEFISTKL